MITYASTVIHIDPTRAINKDADQAAASRLLETYHLVTEAAQRIFKQRFQILSARHKQKMG